MLTNEALLVANDAKLAGRAADAYTVLLAHGATLHEACNVLTPVRAPQVGDILACGWGYEQTRFDFYRVIKVTAKSIRIAKIGKRYVSRGAAPGEADVVPTDEVIGEALTKRYEYSETTEYLTCEGPVQEGCYQPLTSVQVTSKFRYRCKISSYSTAYLWEGKTCHESGEY